MLVWACLKFFTLRQTDVAESLQKHSVADSIRFGAIVEFLFCIRLIILVVLEVIFFVILIVVRL